MTALSMPLYYYDEHGYKIGPINKKELYALVEKGVITPETRLTDGTIETKAKNIPKLKFIAPELRRAEEIFNPENIDFNAPITYNAPTIPAPTLPKTTAEKPQYHKEPTIQISIPFQTQQITHKNYSYFQFAQKLFYPIAATIWYGGITLTIIGTIIACLFPPFIPVILIGGLIITFTWSFIFGLTADTIQWLLHTENHLKEIKNRLNQND